MNFYSLRYGHFSGINRKVQMKYQPRGRPRGSSSDDGNSQSTQLTIFFFLNLSFKFLSFAHSLLLDFKSHPAGDDQLKFTFIPSDKSQLSTK